MSITLIITLIILVFVFSYRIIWKHDKYYENRLYSIEKEIPFADKKELLEIKEELNLILHKKHINSHIKQNILRLNKIILNKPVLPTK